MSAEVGRMGGSPKYELVRTRLLDLIDGAEVGSAIAPERKLAASLGVSRMTLRRVIGDLVTDGHLIRKHGSGTFVAEPKIAQPLTMTSFSEDMRQRGLTPGSRTLSLEVVHAGARVGRHLEISPQDEVVRARRLRLADGEPMALETLHAPCALVPGLTAEDLERGSFYELLATRYGIVLGVGLQTTEPTVLSDEEARLLDAPVHSPAFLFERVTRDGEGQPIEYVRSLYRGDRYQLVTELRSVRGRGAQRSRV
jgi:GntR family transcriptional regulator